VTIGSGVFGWLRVKVCIFPYTLKVVLTTLTLPCEVWYNDNRSDQRSPKNSAVCSEIYYFSKTENFKLSCMNVVR